MLMQVMAFTKIVAAYFQSQLQAAIPYREYIELLSVKQGGM